MGTTPDRFVDVRVCAASVRRVKAVQCEQDSNCDLSGGGVCMLNPSTGNHWCTYPDPSCQRGTRWSDFGTGDGLSGIGVADDGMPPDAGIDAPVTPPGADILTGMIKIPAGSFWRGCNPANPNPYACDSTQLMRETPYRQIILSEFCIEKYEVTVQCISTVT
jgi:formylglycine-generating enzyme required for sulfatase activity